MRTAWALIVLLVATVSFAQQKFIAVECDGDARSYWLDRTPAATRYETAGAGRIEMCSYLQCDSQICQDNFKKDVVKYAGWLDKSNTWSAIQNFAGGLRVPVADLTSCTQEGQFQVTGATIKFCSGGSVRSVTENGTLSAAIADHESRITTLEGSSNGGLVARVDALESDVGTLQSDLAALTSTVSGIDTTVDGLVALDIGNRLTNQANDISLLQTGITALAGRVTTLENYNLDSRVSSLQTSVNSLTSQVSTNTTDIGVLQSGLATATGNISNLTGRVQTLESYDANTRLNSQQASITSLQTTVGDHTTSITTLNNQMGPALTDIAALKTDVNTLKGLNIASALSTLSAADIALDGRLDILEGQNLDTRITSLLAASNTHFIASGSGTGQTAVGGVNAGNKLTLNSTTSSTKGGIELSAGNFFIFPNLSGAGDIAQAKAAADGVGGTTGSLYFSDGQLYLARSTSDVEQISGGQGLPNGFFPAGLQNNEVLLYGGSSVLTRVDKSASCTGPGQPWECCEDTGVGTCYPTIDATGEFKVLSTDVPANYTIPQCVRLKEAGQNRDGSNPLNYVEVCADDANITTNGVLRIRNGGLIDSSSVQVAGGPPDGSCVVTTTDVNGKTVLTSSPSSCASLAQEFNPRTGASFYHEFMINWQNLVFDGGWLYSNTDTIDSGCGTCVSNLCNGVGYTSRACGTPGAQSITQIASEANHPGIVRSTAGLSNVSNIGSSAYLTVPTAMWDSSIFTRSNWSLQWSARILTEFEQVAAMGLVDANDIARTGMMPASSWPRGFVGFVVRDHRKTSTSANSYSPTNAYYCKGTDDPFDECSGLNTITFLSSTNTDYCVSPGNGKIAGSPVAMTCCTGATSGKCGDGTIQLAICLSTQTPKCKLYNTGAAIDHNVFYNYRLEMVGSNVVKGTITTANGTQYTAIAGTPNGLGGYSADSHFPSTSSTVFRPMTGNLEWSNSTGYPKTIDIDYIYFKDTGLSR